MTRYNCTREGMGGSFKCIFFGSIYHDGGTCSKTDDCPDKEIDPRDKLQNLARTEATQYDERSK